jgi:hypothetical protein
LSHLAEQHPAEILSAALVVLLVERGDVPRPERPPARTASKHYEPAGTCTRSEAPRHRSDPDTQVSIPNAECYVFEVKVENLSGSTHVALNVGASSAFAVGHAVRIEYQIRGIPQLWSRAYVLDMQPA